MTETSSLYIGAGLLVMILIGYFFTTLVAPRGFSRRVAWVFAPSMGAGICSLIFFLFRRPMFTVEFALFVVLFVAWLGYRRTGLRETVAWSWRPTVLGLLFVAVLGWVTALSVVWVQKGPHGDWDGWVIWNSHARYLYRAGALWGAHIKDTAHADYPLLLPANTARLWRYIGADVPDAGGALCALLAMSGVSVLVGTLWHLRGSSLAFVMGLVLIGTPAYMVHGIGQSADVPLALYFVSTIAFICFYWEKAPAQPRFLVLAGFGAGCASWTKNEGLLFALVTSAVMLVSLAWQRKGALRQLGMYFIGLLPPLLASLFFKIWFVPPTDLINQRSSAELLAKMLDWHRYPTILESFVSIGWSFGYWTLNPFLPLLALIIVCGVDRRIARNMGWVSGCSIVTLVLIGYFAVYVLTNYDLRYHLDSSLDRLIMHVWPSILFLLGLAMKPSALDTVDKRTLPTAQST
jgi:hypothetical protein